VPRKIRELIADLERAGFTDRGGKGSHRYFTHPEVRKIVTILGRSGHDALPYQEKALKKAIDLLKEKR